MVIWSNFPSEVFYVQQQIVLFLEKHSVSVLFQSLKNDDTVAKKDVQRILELSHKQR